MPLGLTARRLTLAQVIGVRIPEGQPQKNTSLSPFSIVTCFFVNIIFGKLLKTISVGRECIIAAYLFISAKTILCYCSILLFRTIHKSRGDIHPDGAGGTDFWERGI